VRRHSLLLPSISLALLGFARPARADGLLDTFRRWVGLSNTGPVAANGAPGAPGLSTFGPLTQRPVFGQEKGTSCVYASTRMILATLGVDVTEESLRSAGGYAGAVAKGSYPNFGDGKALLERHGVREAVERDFTISGEPSNWRAREVEWLVEATRDGSPALLRIRDFGGHAVVLDGFDQAGNALIRDPIHGGSLRVLTRAELMDAIVGQATSTKGAFPRMRPARPRIRFVDASDDDRADVLPIQGRRIRILPSTGTPGRDGTGADLAASRAPRVTTTGLAVRIAGEVDRTSKGREAEK
jgi:hypothetical protein